MLFRSYITVKGVVSMTAAMISGYTLTEPTRHQQAKPSLREKAISAIVNETGCSQRDAEAAVSLIEEWVNDARKNGYEWVLPTDRQLRSKAYQIFRQVIPHGAAAKPGSAHAAVENAVLRGPEFSFRHDMQGTGEEVYCGVCVYLDHAS